MNYGTENWLGDGTETKVPLLPRNEFSHPPLKPQYVARPVDWDQILSSDSWKNGTPEARLRMLEDHTKHGLRWMVQQGTEQEKAIGDATQFFKAWRMHALDNAVHPGEQASSELVTGLSDFVFGQLVGGTGVQLATPKRLAFEKEDYQPTPEQEKEWTRRWKTAQDDNARQALRDELDYKHGMELVEDGEKVWFFQKQQTELTFDPIGSIVHVGGEVLQAVGEGLKDASRSKIEKVLRKNPALAETFLLGDLPRGFASVLGFVGVGALTGWAGVLAAGSSAEAEAMYFAGEEAGLSPGEKKNLIGWGSLIGASEVFGLGSKLNILKHTPFGKVVETGVMRYIGGGARETVEELFQDIMINLVEKYGGVDPERKILDPATMLRTAGVTMITGSSLAGLERSDAVILLKAQRAMNGITRDTALSVLEGSHAAVKTAQRVIDSPEATEEQRAKAQEMVEMWRDRAAGMLSAVDQSEAILRDATQVMGMQEGPAAAEPDGEQEAGEKAVSPLERVMLPEHIVQLRDASPERFRVQWDDYDAEQRGALRKALGVAGNAPLAKVQAALKEQAAAVAVEPDLAQAALPELLEHWRGLNERRGQQSEMTVYRTPAEIEAAFDRMSAGEDTGPAMQAAASAVGVTLADEQVDTDITAKTGARPVEILGANKLEYEAGVKRGVVAILSGRQAPETLVREKAQEWAKFELDEGNLDLNAIREERKKIETFHQEQDPHTWTDEGMLEWLSDLALDNFNNKVALSQTMPKNVRDFFAALLQWARDLMSRAIRLRKAMEGGAISPEFESILDQASGLQEGKAHDPYAGLSTEEAAHLGRMLPMDRDAASEHLSQHEEVSDAVVLAYRDAKRREANAARGAGKIPLTTLSVEEVNPEPGHGGTTLSLGKKAREPRMSRESLRDARNALDGITRDLRSMRAMAPGSKRDVRRVSLADAEALEKGEASPQKLNLEPGDEVAVKRAAKRRRDAIHRATSDVEMFQREAEKARGKGDEKEAAKHDRAAASAQKVLDALNRQTKLSVDLNEQTRDAYAQRLRLIEHIRTLEGIVAALPKELRGAVGGFSQVAGKGVQGRIKELEARTEEAFRALDAHTRNVLLNDADKLFAVGKVRLDPKRRATSDIGPEAVAELAEIAAVAELDGEAVAAEMTRLTATVDTITDPEEHATATRRLLHLVRFGNLRGRTADELFAVVEDLRELVDNGKLARSAAEETRRQEEKDLRDRMIRDSIEGGQGWRNSRQASQQNDMMGTLRKGWEQLVYGNLDWAYLLNRITRADKATGHMGSDLVKWGTRLVHRATRLMERTQGRAESELNVKLAEISGIDTGQKGWKFKVKKAWAKLDEHVDTGIFRLEIPDRARFKRDVLLLTARNLRSGKLSLAESDFTADQRAAIVDALNEHESLIASTAQSLEDAKADLEQATAEGRDEAEIKELSAIVRGHQSKLAGLRKRSSLRGVDLTDMSQANLTEQRLSQSQAIRITMSWRQADVRPIMEYHGYSKEFMAEMENWLTPEAKALRDYLAEKYEQGYAELNEVYRRIYGADLPKVRNYSPMSYYHANQKPDMQFGSDVPTGGSLSPGFTFTRLSAHRARPNFEAGALAVYARHVAQQAHFIAFAEPVRQLRAVLGHKETQESIRSYYGDEANKSVQNMLQYFADKGNKNADVVLWVDRVRRNVVMGGLSWNWTQVVKQPTGALAYTFGMPVGKFLKYEAEFLSNPIGNARRMWQIPFVKERFQSGAERDVIAILSGKMDRKAGGEVKVPTALDEALTAGMWFVRAGDLGSTIVGGYAAFRHGQDTYLRQAEARGEDINSPEVQEAAEQEGIYQLEAMTELYQTGGNVKDQSPRELGGSYERMFTTFLSNSRKYYLATWEAAGDWKAGREGAGADFAKRLFIGHILLPAAWQGVVDLLKMATADDDDDREEVGNPRNWTLAMLLGPLAGFYALGQGLDMGLRYALGVRAWSKPIPIIDAVASTLREAGDLAKAAEGGFTAEEVADVANDTARAMSRITGSWPLAYDIAVRNVRSVGLDDNLGRALWERETAGPKRAAQDMDKRWDSLKEKAGIVQKKGGPMTLRKDKADAVAKLQAMREAGDITAQEFKDLKESVEGIAKRATDGRTKEERRIANLGVASGARAAYIRDRLGKMSPGQRAEFEKRWRGFGWRW